MNFDYVFDNEPDIMEKKQTIRVVYVEPGKLAREAEIGTELEDLQAAVGGWIETYYPFDEACVIVCDDEGKYDGALPNRAVYGKDGKVMDILFGPFFICDCSGEEFGSLTDEQVQKYTDMFRRPERFVMAGGDIKVSQYDPREKHRDGR